MKQNKGCVDQLTHLLLDGHLLWPVGHTKLIDVPCAIMLLTDNVNMWVNLCWLLYQNMLKSPDCFCGGRKCGLVMEIRSSPVLGIVVWCDVKLL